jgi:branched-chain amino acid transport system ATP-binding protein
MSDAVLELQAVERTFGKVAALRGVSTTLGGPGITGIIGPNGSGKTTLTNVVSGVLRPTRGRVVWKGRDISRLGVHRIVGLGISRTFQHSMTFTGLTVAENVVIALEAAGRDRHDVDRFFSDDSPFPALAPYRDAATADLPFGIDRQLGILLATVAGPELLLLDEPAAGLNNLEMVSLAAAIRAVADYGTSLGVIDHDMSFLLPLCRRVLVLDAGEILADGTPDEIRADERVIATYLGSGVAAG